MIDLSADIRHLSAYGDEDQLKELLWITPGEFPNQRRLIIPDPGYTFVDMDLDRADAQFVAWEANDELLKQILKEGLDLHFENAKMIWGEHIKAKGPERQLAKRFCHAVNYGAWPKRLAKALGIDVKLAEWIYARWFKIHPGIKEWHRRTKEQLFLHRFIRNPFGFERYYFERPEDVINEALAWLPQSSVGIIINTAWSNIDKNLPKVEVLKQVHDSLNMQILSELVTEQLPLVEEQSLITVPYDDPLIIPVGFKVSPISWGDCEPPCCDKIMQSPEPYRQALDQKTNKPIFDESGKPKMLGCRDHKLHNELNKVLLRAKQTASTRLAGSVPTGL